MKYLESSFKVNSIPVVYVLHRYKIATQISIYVVQIDLNPFFPNMSLFIDKRYASFSDGTFSVCLYFFAFVSIIFEWLNSYDLLHIKSFLQSYGIFIDVWVLFVVLEIRLSDH